MRDHARRLPLRLAQFSPLVAGLLLVAILAVVGTSVASLPQMLATGLEPSERAMWLAFEEQVRVAEAAGLWGTADSLDAAAEESWQRTVERQDTFITENAAMPLPFASDDEVFVTLTDWEKVFGGQVWAWVVLGGGEPAVVASATPDPAALVEVTAQVQFMADDPTFAGRAPITVPEYLLSMGGVSFGGLRTPVVGSPYTAGDAGGMGFESTSAFGSTISVGGELWFIGGVTTGTLPGDGGTPVPADLLSVDPRSSGYQSLVADIAAREHVNIWVMGPMITHVVPLRVPSQGDRSVARDLGEAIWSDYAFDPMSFSVQQLLPLDDEPARLAGATHVAYTMESVSNANGPSMFAADVIPPQTVLYAAVFDGLPSPRTTLVGDAWSSWRRFVISWFPQLLAAGAGLLVLTLVIAPAALMVERRMNAADRLRADAERIRRDAHDKVYNRLSALAKRVSEAGTDSESAEALSGIAADIRATVADLQEILGEPAHHTDAAPTGTRIGPQIESVCAAQSARLGVKVVCDTAGEPDGISPRLGWDLQCVAEEAVTNAVRHGSASLVRVTLSEAPEGFVMLTVVDNGSGSTVTSPGEAPEGSTGLRGMEARLATHGGTLELATGDDGTTLTAQAPLG